MYNDDYYMSMAVELASSARGKTGKNPPVGCVITQNGSVLSSGCTSIDGKIHAEEHAINKLPDNIKKTGLCLYVTLEPCYKRSFFLKKSCVRKIILKKISRVVIGVLDPNPRTYSKSVNLLKNNGIKVKVGVLENECKFLIKDFEKKYRPFITLKIAMSLDGKIALANGQSQWITSHHQRVLSHKLRRDHDAILTGIGTILADDPLLTCRLVNSRKPITRIILDSNGRIPSESRIVKTSNLIKTIVFTSKRCVRMHDHINFIGVNNGEDGLCIDEVLNYIRLLGIKNLLIEGGQKITTTFIKYFVVDKVVVFQSNKIIGNEGLSIVGDLKIRDLKKCPKFKTIFINK